MYFDLFKIVGFIAWVFLANTPFVQAQLVINEVCSHNSSTQMDEFSEFSDWIELYNDSDQILHLELYYLSDDKDDLFKFRLANQELQPHQFIMVFASGLNLNANYNHTNFKLKSTGESLFVTRMDGHIVSSMDIPKLKEDQSYGRSMNSLATLLYFDTPSPFLSNATVQGHKYVHAPRSDKKSGFYRNKININLNQLSGYDIRYTTDGSEVTLQSDLFSEKLIIDQTTCLKIRSFDENGFPSEERSYAYFFEEASTLDVVHLSFDPHDLYDWENGIFVAGPDADSEYPYYGANFWKDIEVPVTFEFFKERKSQGVFDLKAKIHGGRASRSNPMQSVRLIADHKYGDAYIYGSFFDESQIRKYKTLVLRNASGDYNYTHCRDAYLARYFAKEGLDLDLLHHRPVTVYINGMYHGVMNIREKIDKHYIESRGGIDGEFDLLEEEDMTVQGNFELFNEHYNYAMTTDLSIDDNFQFIRDHFDLSNMMDYVTCQMIINNTDWPQNNIKFWRPHQDTAKWRYILFDMDASMGRFGWTKLEYDYLDRMDELEGLKLFDLFRAFLTNQTFKEAFITRYLDLLNSTFRSELWLKESTNAYLELEADMQAHFQKWGMDEYPQWAEIRIPELLYFAENREDYAREFLQDYFDIHDQIQLDIDVFPPGSGQIKINTISTSKLPWNGIYFDEIPIRLDALANDGYEFSHWQNEQGVIIHQEGMLDSLFAEDVKLIAHFDGEYKGLQSNLYPNPLQDKCQVDLVLKEFGSVQFDFYRVDGSLVESRIFQNQYAGLRSYHIDDLNLKSGMGLLKISTKTDTQIIKFITFNDD